MRSRSRRPGPCRRPGAPYNRAVSTATGPLEPQARAPRAGAGGAGATAPGAPPARGPLPSFHWRLATPAPAALLRDWPGEQAEAPVRAVLAAALAARGHATPEAAAAFLGRGEEDDNPFRMAGMAQAVARVRAALRAREAIAVYGDYDADGVTATALLAETLDALGAARVETWIPHRAREGYGVHAEALRALAARGVRLLVTVDCGIRANAELELARDLGMDVIVSDHHALPAALPQALAILNPRRPDCRYGFQDFAGVGLAFKLAQGLLRVARRMDGAVAAGAGAEPAAGRRHLAEADLLDLVALGTVADVVPLRGENRRLVQRGLAGLRAPGRPGIRALFESAGRDPAGVTARDLSHLLGPRLNAAGRMGDARTALELLLSRDLDSATALAATIEGLQQERRAATDAALAAARARLRGRAAGAFLVDRSEEVPLGVIGLVAGRLAEEYYRPVAVLRDEGDLARGSARSIPEFDVVAALDANADLLLQHGGHARAAGFTLRSDDVPALEARLAAAAETRLAGLALRPSLAIDAQVAPEALSRALAQALEALEPCGEGNPPARLWVPRVPTRGARVVGREGRHLKLVLAGSGGMPVEAIAYERGADLARLGPTVDLVGSLRLGAWNGLERLELRVDDLAAPAEPA